MDWNSIINALSGAGQKSGFILPANEGGGGNWPAIGTMLGQVAQGIAPQGTWQSGLGQAGQQIGQSTIAAKAGEKLSSQRKPFTDIYDIVRQLGGFTPSGEAGPTGVTLGKSGDYTLKGDLAPFTEDESLKRTSTPANFRPSPAGLSKTDLVGLSPEQIGSLLSQQLAGSQMDLESLKTAYAMAKPREGQIVEGADSYYVVDPVSGKAIKTNVQPYHKPETGSGVSDAWLKPTELTGWDKEGNPISMKVPFGSYNQAVRQIEAAGGRVGEAPGQVRELQGKLAAAEVTANSSKASKDERLTAGRLYNSLADNTSIYAYKVEDPFWGRFTSEKVMLPKTADGRQLTMEDVRRVALDNSDTIENVINQLVD